MDMILSKLSLLLLKSAMNRWKRKEIALNNTAYYDIHDDNDHGPVIMMGHDRGSVIMMALTIPALMVMIKVMPMVIAGDIS